MVFLEPVQELVVGCIDQGNAGVRSGRAGDALCIVKRPRRGDRVTLVDPKGRLFKTLGRRPTVTGRVVPPSWEASEPVRSRR